MSSQERRAAVAELYAYAGLDPQAAALLEQSLAPRPRSMLMEEAALLGLGPGQLVLDAGCRDGRYAIPLVQRFRCRVVGWTWSTPRLRAARPTPRAQAWLGRSASSKANWSRCRSVVAPATWCGAGTRWSTSATLAASCESAGECSAQESARVPGFSIALAADPVRGCLFDTNRRASSGKYYRGSPVRVTRTEGALAAHGLQGLGDVAGRREPLLAKRCFMSATQGG